MSISHLYVFFGEVSVHVFCPFFDMIICFVCVEFKEFFIDLDISPLSVLSFGNIFSHSMGCLFVLLTVSFAVQKLLILMKSQKLPSTLWSNNLRQNRKKYTVEKKIVSSVNGAGKTGQLYVEE